MKYLMPLLLNLLLLLLYFFKDVKATTSMIIVVINLAVVPVYLMALYYKALSRYSTVQKVQVLFGMIGVIFGCGTIQLLFWGITDKTLFVLDSTTVEIIYQTAKWGTILLVVGACIMNIIDQVKMHLKNKDSDIMN